MAENNDLSVVIGANTEGLQEVKSVLTSVASAMDRFASSLDAQSDKIQKAMNDLASSMAGIEGGAEKATKGMSHASKMFEQQKKQIDMMTRQLSNLETGYGSLSGASSKIDNLRDTFDKLYESISTGDSGSLLKASKEWGAAISKTKLDLKQLAKESKVKLDIEPIEERDVDQEMNNLRRYVVQKKLIPLALKLKLDLDTDIQEQIDNLLRGDLTKLNTNMSEMLSGAFSGGDATFAENIKTAVDNLESTYAKFGPASMEAKNALQEFNYVLTVGSAAVTDYQKGQEESIAIQDKYADSLRKAQKPLETLTYQLKRMGTEEAAIEAERLKKAYDTLQNSLGTATNLREQQQAYKEYDIAVNKARTSITKMNDAVKDQARADQFLEGHARVLHRAKTALQDLSAAYNRYGTSDVEEKVKKLNDAFSQLESDLASAKSVRDQRLAFMKFTQTTNEAGREIKALRETFNGYNKYVNEVVRRTSKLKSAFEAAGKSSSELSGLDDYVRDYAAAVAKFGSGSDQAGIALAKFNNKYNELRGSMSVANDPLSKFNRTMTEVSTTAQLIYGPLSGVAARITAIGAMAKRTNLALAGIVSGIAAVAGSSGMLTMYGTEQEKMFAQFEGQLKQTGRQAQITAEELDEMAKALAIDTLTSTAEARQATGVLMTFSSLTVSEFDRILRASQSMAQGLGNTLVESAKRLGKALETPGEVIEGLSDMGIVFTETEKAMYSQMMLTGQAFEARADILSKVEERMGSIATDVAQGLAGSFDTVMERMNHMFSAAATQSGMLESFSAVLGKVDNAIIEMYLSAKNGEGMFYYFGKALSYAADALAIFIENIGRIGNALIAFGGVFVTLKAIVALNTLLIAGTAAWAAGIAKVKAAMLGLMAIVQSLGPARILIMLASMAAGIGAFFMSSKDNADDAKASLKAYNDELFKTMKEERERNRIVSDAEAKLRKNINDYESTLAIRQSGLIEKAEELRQLIESSRVNPQVDMSGTISGVADQIAAIGRQIEETTKEIEKGKEALDGYLEKTGGTEDTQRTRKLAEYFREFSSITVEVTKFNQAQAVANKTLEDFTTVGEDGTRSFEKLREAYMKAFPTATEIDVDLFIASFMEMQETIADSSPFGKAKSSIKELRMELAESSKDFATMFNLDQEQISRDATKFANQVMNSLIGKSSTDRMNIAESLGLDDISTEGLRDYYITVKNTLSVMQDMENLRSGSVSTRESELAALAKQESYLQTKLRALGKERELEEALLLIKLKRDEINNRYNNLNKQSMIAMLAVQKAYLESNGQIFSQEEQLARMRAEETANDIVNKADLLTLNKMLGTEYDSLVNAQKAASATIVQWLLNTKEKTKEVIEEVIKYKDALSFKISIAEAGFDIKGFDLTAAKIDQQLKTMFDKVSPDLIEEIFGDDATLESAMDKVRSAIKYATAKETYAEAVRGVKELRREIVEASKDYSAIFQLDQGQLRNDAADFARQFTSSLSDLTDLERFDIAKLLGLEGLDAANLQEFYITARNTTTVLRELNGIKTDETPTRKSELAALEEKLKTLKLITGTLKDQSLTQQVLAAIEAQRAAINSKYDDANKQSLMDMLKLQKDYADATGETFAQEQLLARMEAEAIAKRVVSTEELESVNEKLGKSFKDRSEAIQYFIDLILKTRKATEEAANAVKNLKDDLSVKISIGEAGFDIREFDLNAAKLEQRVRGILTNVDMGLIEQIFDTKEIEEAVLLLQHSIRKATAKEVYAKAVDGVRRLKMEIANASKDFGSMFQLGQEQISMQAIKFADDMMASLSEMTSDQRLNIANSLGLEDINIDNLVKYYTTSQNTLNVLSEMSKLKIDATTRESELDALELQTETLLMYLDTLENEQHIKEAILLIDLKREAIHKKYNEQNMQAMIAVLGIQKAYLESNGKVFKQEQQLAKLEAEVQAKRAIAGLDLITINKVLGTQYTELEKAQGAALEKVTQWLLGTKEKADDATDAVTALKDALSFKISIAEAGFDIKDFKLPIERINQEVEGMFEGVDINLVKQVFDGATIKSAKETMQGIIKASTAKDVIKDALSGIEDFNKSATQLAVDRLDEEERIRLQKLEDQLLQEQEFVTERAEAVMAIEKYYDHLRLLETDKMYAYLQNAHEQWASNFSDTLLNALETGKVEFSDFVKSIVRELAKIEMTKSLSPLMQFGTNFLTSFIPGAPAATADNKIPNNGLVPFAKGAAFTNSVVSKPTLFPFASGTGLMGEAGPEAIMPLTRLSGGDLGVKAVGGGTEVYVNIIDQRSSGQEPEVTETTGADGRKTISVIIKDEVKGMFASGEVDRLMRTNYGINRTGYRR